MRAAVAWVAEREHRTTLTLVMLALFIGAALASLPESAAAPASCNEECGGGECKSDDGCPPYCRCATLEEDGDERAGTCVDRGR